MECICSDYVVIFKVDYFIVIDLFWIIVYLVVGLKVEGVDVFLFCDVDGNLVLMILWIRNGFFVDLSDSFRISFLVDKK